jgi:rhodanese-related sulfurtransferase
MRSNGSAPKAYGPRELRTLMVEELTPTEVSRRLQRSDSSPPVLLDVREPFERQLARIEPSLHIPMDEVPARLSELSRDREIVVYCHSGGRSAMVAGFLEQQGFSHVANLSGGIDAWAREVDRKVPRYG